MRALLLIVVCIRAQHHSDPYQSVQNSKDLRAQYNQEHRAHQATHERKRLEASRKKEVKKNRDEFHKARQNSKDNILTMMAFLWAWYQMVLMQIRW